ncbi:MAG: hypothetical protein ACR2IK_19985 [Chloroflexota bacterium]
MSKASIDSLTTENIEVARLVAAHNIAAELFDTYGTGANQDSPETQAERYLTLFNKIYSATSTTAQSTATPLASHYPAS